MISLLSLTLLLGCRSSYEGEPSDHFNGDTFFNPWSAFDGNLLRVIKWKLTSIAEDWPTKVQNTSKPQWPNALAENEVAITFVNHASFLIQFGGFHMLTDPVWSDRVSPLSWMGPKRVRSPGIAFDELPHIDLVIISHNHYDHLDLPTLQKLSDRDHPIVLVPLGDKIWLEKAGVQNVHEMDWWQPWERQSEVGPFVVNFAPAQHWSARGIFDRNKSLWGSYVIQHKGRQIYFAGDTGYGPHFKEIVAKYGPQDLALLPIGAYEPRWFMKYQHMNPAESIQAHFDLKAKTSIGMHFGTWQLTDEGIDKPVEALDVEKKRLKVDDVSFRVPEVGATYIYKL